MIYPKKKRKAGFGLDLSQLKLKDGIESGAMTFGSDLTSGILDKAGTQDLGYGVSHQSAGTKVASGLISGAGKGAQMGSSFGAPGMALGAAIGGGIGLGKAAIDAIRNPRSLAEMIRDSKELQAITAQNRKGTAGYNALEQKQVMEDGGEIPDGEDQPTNDKAVILGGKRHKDGGNDILDQNGNKVAETEREEIVFTKDQTEIIERSIKMIEAGEEEEYLNLGSYLKDLVLNRTQDDSGKFKKLANDVE